MPGVLLSTLLVLAFHKAILAGTFTPSFDAVAAQLGGGDDAELGVDIDAQLGVVPRLVKPGSGVASS